jgi:hypothetical protein
MNPHDERELREHFAALRDEDAASAPAFPGVLRRKAPSSPARRVRFVSIVVLGAAAAATAFLLVVLPRGPDRSIEAAIAQAKSLSSWTAPTDRWLTLSGLEIPDSVPSLSLSSVTLPETSAPSTTAGESP